MERLLIHALNEVQFSVIWSQGLNYRKRFSFPQDFDKGDPRNLHVGDQMSRILPTALGMSKLTPQVASLVFRVQKSQCRDYNTSTSRLRSDALQLVRNQRHNLPNKPQYGTWVDRITCIFRHSMSLFIKVICVTLSRVLKLCDTKWAGVSVLARGYIFRTNAA